MIRAEGLKQAMDVLTRAKTRVPQAVSSAAQVQQYLPHLRRLAQQVIYLNTEPHEELAIYQLTRTISADQFASGFALAMSVPSTEGEVADRRALIDFVLDPENDATLLEWVTTYKDLDQRDMNADGSQRPAEEIATRVRSAILANADAWLGGSADGLASFAGLQGVAVGAEKASMLLMLVLDAWRDYLREVLPGRISAEIRKALR